jgi:sugar O-acyltransferase (sialic acid O-acetyltransferase NeuD family)
VSEVIRREGRYRIVCILDDNAAPGGDDSGPLVGGREMLSTLAAKGVRSGFVAIGNNTDRELVTMVVERAGLSLVSPVDPAAVVADGVPIGTGTVLMPFSVAAAASSVGRGVILNTTCSVDHDCVIGDFAHLSVGVHLGGGCHVGARSVVGIGAVLSNGITLGERVVIGAGAAVLADVPAGVVAAGVPARPLSSTP